MIHSDAMDDASSVGQASRLSGTAVGGSMSGASELPSQISSSSRTGGTPVLPYKPFDRAAPVAFYGRHLPHWRQEGCTYFVTFRLGDSIPQSKLQQWEAELACWLRAHAQPHSEQDRREFHEKFTKRFHEWLDAGYGSCWLRRSDVADLVEGALKYFDRERYVLGHFVVMPNHVHVLVTPMMRHELSEILQSWKSFTAHAANQLLSRSGKFWQDESFDHIVRDETHLRRFERYILENPTMAGLKPGGYRVGCGSGGVLGEVGQASRLSSVVSCLPQENQDPKSQGDAPAPSGTGGTPVLPP